MLISRQPLVECTRLRFDASIIIEISKEHKSSVDLGLLAKGVRFASLTGAARRKRPCLLPAGFVHHTPQALIVLEGKSLINVEVARIDSGSGVLEIFALEQMPESQSELPSIRLVRGEPVEFLTDVGPRITFGTHHD